MYDKAKIRAAKLQIRRVFLEEWDPIGVRDEPNAQDEYDGYLGGVYELLARAATEDEIAAHLREIETVRMGGRGQGQETLLGVARSLRRIAL